ncbi:hypothetical protein EDB89DRAFT_1911636 [Lactarius sanguifluus]|nr:hypothetical protein EDB89DRAFT_1911636 [Lactarius sanguifluus]
MMFLAPSFLGMSLDAESQSLPQGVRDNTATCVTHGVTVQRRASDNGDDHKDDDHDNGHSNGPGCSGTDDDGNDDGAAVGGIGGGDGDGDGGRDSERSDGDGDGDVGSGVTITRIVSRGFQGRSASRAGKVTDAC